MSRHETSLRVAGNALVLAVLTALAAWLASLQSQPWLQVAPTRMQVLAATAITAAYLVACALPWWRRHTQARSDARLDEWSPQLAQLDARLDKGEPLQHLAHQHRGTLGAVRTRGVTRGAAHHESPAR